MVRTSRAAGLLLAIGSLLLMAGCGAPAGASGGKSGQLQIVASFYPFQFVAEQVAGSHATVESLTKPGAEPHDLELTPKQVGSVTDADLVVYEQHFQASVDEAVEQSGNKNVLDTSTVVPLQDHGPLGDDENDPNDRAGNANLDPHVWLDPNNMITITDAVAAKLVTIDPPHAADYRKNAGRLDHQLHGLDSSYRSGLKSCQRTQFVTSHAAFGYLAQRYGLTQISITGLSPDNEPSPARIAAVQEQISRDDVTTIFYETLASPAVAQSIAHDLHLKTDVLDPLEGITDHSRGTNYLAVMKSNLTALEKANGCSFEMMIIDEGSVTDQNKPENEPATHREVVLSATDISVELGGLPVLRGISLEVHRGETVALLGGNGSGKSTLVRTLLGLTSLRRGSVRLFGTDIARFRDWSKVGYVPQRSTVDLTRAKVNEIVGSGRLGHRLPFVPPRARDRQVVGEALEVVGLADRAQSEMQNLSGGQQQRVLIARALAAEPRLLVLDEPTAGVDLEHQQILADVLTGLLRRGMAILVVLHEIGPLTPLVGRAIVLRDGRIVHDGDLPRSATEFHDHQRAGHGGHEIGETANSTGYGAFPAGSDPVPPGSSTSGRRSYRRSAS